MGPSTLVMSSVPPAVAKEALLCAPRRRGSWGQPLSDRVKGRLRVAKLVTGVTFPHTNTLTVARAGKSERVPVCC